MQPQCENCGQNRHGKDFTIAVGILTDYKQSQQGNMTRTKWQYNIHEELTAPLCDACQSAVHKKYIKLGALWLLPPIIGVLLVVFDGVFFRLYDKAMIICSLTLLASIYTIFFMEGGLLSAIRAKKTLCENRIAKLKKQAVATQYGLQPNRVCLPDWFIRRRPNQIGEIKLMNQKELKELV